MAPPTRPPGAGSNHTNIMLIGQDAQPGFQWRCFIYIVGPSRIVRERLRGIEPQPREPLWSLNARQEVPRVLYLDILIEKLAFEKEESKCEIEL